MTLPSWEPASKTYIGWALCNATCRKLISVKYARLPALLAHLSHRSRWQTTKKPWPSTKKYLALFSENYGSLNIETCGPRGAG